MSQDPQSLSDAILIMPYWSANPKYGDGANEVPSTSHTFREKFLFPVLHMPQLVLPFAQIPYESRVTGNTEYRPIATTLIGAKGSDLMFIELAKAALSQASWPTRISTGRLMYPIGDNLRNVENIQTDEFGAGFCVAKKMQQKIVPTKK
ncbi:hypothetical protein CC86DRAFT_387012 [Ophiobolus disseminans]|uniref:Uncharacterized protein n=1 Tax=Ophiobolus disseminans TaxID=1469910 RepID=A0A6A6ZHC1_9PLEO|nr:hypothetical protein CC86DRAFT_387012 [Ophiobolus disseminans]